MGRTFTAHVQMWQICYGSLEICNTVKDSASEWVLEKVHSYAVEKSAHAFQNLYQKI